MGKTQIIETIECNARNYLIVRKILIGSLETIKSSIKSKMDEAIKTIREKEKQQETEEYETFISQDALLKHLSDNMLSLDSIKNFANNFEIVNSYFNTDAQQTVTSAFKDNAKLIIEPILNQQKEYNDISLGIANFITNTQIIINRVPKADNTKVEVFFTKAKEQYKKLEDKLVTYSKLIESIQSPLAESKDSLTDIKTLLEKFRQLQSLSKDITEFFTELEHIQQIYGMVNKQNHLFNTLKDIKINIKKSTSQNTDTIEQKFTALQKNINSMLTEAENRAKNDVLAAEKDMCAINLTIQNLNKLSYPDHVKQSIKDIVKKISLKNTLKKAAEITESINSQANAARLLAEEKAEKERLLAEEKAEKERLLAEEKAEKERLLAAKKAKEDAINTFENELKILSTASEALYTKVISQTVTEEEIVLLRNNLSTALEKLNNYPALKASQENGDNYKKVNNLINEIDTLSRHEILPPAKDLAKHIKENSFNTPTNINKRKFVEDTIAVLGTIFSKLTAAKWGAQVHGVLQRLWGEKINGHIQPRAVTFTTKKIDKFKADNKSTTDADYINNFEQLMSEIVTFQAERILLNRIRSGKRAKLTDEVYTILMQFYLDANLARLKQNLQRHITDDEFKKIINSPESKPSHLRLENK